MEINCINKKTKLLLIFLFIWAFLITAHLFYYTIWKREYYLEKGKALSEKQGTIPALRGSIIDSKMVPLAWSERYYDLRLKPYSKQQTRQERIFKALKEIIPDIEYVENESRICLKQNLSPIVQVKCIKLIKYFRELEITSRIVRKQIDSKAIKSILGLTKEKNGIIYGISGLEKNLDKELRGEKGVFKVMVDRLGRWIPGTWEEKKDSIPGEDIILNYTLTELKNNPENIIYDKKKCDNMDIELTTKTIKQLLNSQKDENE